MGIDDEYDITTDDAAKMLNTTKVHILALVKLLKMKPQRIPNRMQRYVFCDDDVKKMREAISAKVHYDLAIERLRNQ